MTAKAKAKPRRTVAKRAGKKPAAASAALVEGAGKLNHFVRLESAATLDRPEVAAVIDAAIARAKAPFPASGRGRLVIRSISAKQRARRRPAR